MLMTFVEASCHSAGRRDRENLAVATRIGSGRMIGSVCGLAFAALAISPAQAGLFDWTDSPRYEEQRPDARPLPPKPKRKTPRPAVAAGKEAIPTGPLQIVVSLVRQRVTVFAGDRRIGEAPVSTGTASHPTPMGVFSVISKARYHASNIYSGAPMPYMHRITWSGIALHEGVLPGYPASHGCIRLPGAFASRLFRMSKLGARVVVTRDPVAPVAFDSARLFVARPLVPKKPDELSPSVEAVTAAPATAEASLAQDVGDPHAIAAEVKVADITGTAGKPAAPGAALDVPKRKGPVQVFVSRKDGKLYVRQGFAPLFDAPVTIAQPDKPWGTHVFTAIEIKDGATRWTAMTIPSGFTAKADRDRRGRKLSQKDSERHAQRVFDLANAPTAAEALERFEMPKDAIDRIAELLAAGSSLVVSDNALSNETGEGTDFIIATR